MPNVHIVDLYCAIAEAFLHHPLILHSSSRPTDVYLLSTHVSEIRSQHVGIAISQLNFRGNFTRLRSRVHESNKNHVLPYLLD